MELKENDIKKLSELARVSLEGQEERLISSMREILNYFSILEEVDTSNVEPMSGGTGMINELRSDEGGKKRPYTGSGTAEFRDSGNGFMKVPSVFGEHD